MPFLVPLLLGASTGAYFFNKFDDKFIDPIFSEPKKEIISTTKLVAVAVIVAGFLYANKKGIV